eukprot:CAMPEP_0183760264 /NCGR_PEP_ID=MMETSP0739-20130205/7651_1 /TAXON_ID=385413 /ORGANISM="Thalassiosira miniscula, Strain CCMP1093" /LENGTH=97 /DNA_ID=CAMNT_0025998215 /DNA_START=196 /DNA_END=486 /DNA_ORIENTATION=-
MDDYDSSCDSSPYRLSAISDISHFEEHSDDWDDNGDDCDGRITQWGLRNKFISTSMRDFDDMDVQALAIDYTAALESDQEESIDETSVETDQCCIPT